MNTISYGLEALASWFADEYQALLRFAYLICGDRTLAEDLVQETFLRLHRASARVEPAGAGAYARRTLVNLHRSRLRRMVIEKRLLGGRTQFAVLDHAESRPDDRIWAALGTLSPQQRACVALRYYEQMKEREIADALGVSLGAVKKQLDRALTKLRGLNEGGLRESRA